MPYYYDNKGYTHSFHLSEKKMNKDSGKKLE